jgi:hypothetical protein
VSLKLPEGVSERATMTRCCGFQRSTDPSRCFDYARAPSRDVQRRRGGAERRREVERWRGGEVERWRGGEVESSAYRRAATAASSVPRSVRSRDSVSRSTATSAICSTIFVSLRRGPGGAGLVRLVTLRTAAEVESRERSEAARRPQTLVGHVDAGGGAGGRGSTSAAVGVALTRSVNVATLGAGDSTYTPTRP